MKIAIIGAGHVGLVTAACFAELGNEVVCTDNDKEKIKRLEKGEIPFYEPGLQSLVDTNTVEGRLSFHDQIGDNIADTQVIFICVGTPTTEKGEADLSAVEDVSRKIGQFFFNIPSLTVKNKYKLVVEKSTVPVQTGEWVKKIIQKNSHPEVDFEIASNPEFLREGSAVHDFMYPDRIILGVESEKAASLLIQLYLPLNAPLLITDIKSAELIKHASNAFLSTKISFINAVANICEKTGADVEKVAKGIGLDQRIGLDFLKAGIGYGGSCFPKDIAAFIQIAEKLGYDFRLLKEVSNINQHQRESFLAKVEKSLGSLKNKTLAIWGLSFKPDTDDIRNAPSLDIIESLLKKGAQIKAFDPQAMSNMKKIYPQIEYCSSAYEAVKDAEGLLILTEWAIFRSVNLREVKSLLKRPLIVDGRNFYEPEKMKSLGFTYLPVGRGKV